MIALPAFLVVLAAFRLFGDRMARAAGLQSDRPLERLGIALALSFAAVTLLVFLLALARAVGFASSALLVVAMAVVGRASARGALEDLRAGLRAVRGPRTVRWSLGALAAAVILLGLVAAMAPPTGMDTLIFHFVAVKRMAEVGGLLADPSPHFHRTGGFYFPYLLAFSLQGDLLAKLLNFAAGAAAIGLSGAVGERLRPGAGAPAAAAAALTPVVSSYLGAEYLELPAQLYVSAALLSAVRARESGDGRWAAAALAFLGCAVGVKTSAFHGALLALPVLAAGARTLPSLALGTALAALMAGFWPAWNLASTGAWFPAYDLEGVKGTPVTSAEGKGAAVLAILRSLATTSRHYWSESLGPLLVVGTAGAALFDLRRDGRRLAGLALLVLAGYLAVLWLAAPGMLQHQVHSHVRYLAPSLVPLGAAAAGLLLAAGLDGPPALRRLALASVLLPALALLPLKAARTAFAAPAALGLEPAAAYLSRKIETYPVCALVNGLPGDVRVLPLVERPYHLERPWVEPERLGPPPSTAEAFAAALRSRSITHVVVEPRVPERLGYPADDRLFRPPHFREIGEGWPHWDGRRIRVYALDGD